MRDALPFALLDDPEQLATYDGWSADFYRDLLDFQAGRMSHAELDARYLYRTTILTLDMTGFTTSCFEGRQVEAFLRILNAQKVCIPVLHEFDATLVRAFADDLVALFDAPGKALDAAQEIHRRIELFNASGLATERPAYCSIGIGFGDVYRIGPNLSMGDEMNRAAKLGEDIARGNETLVTTNVYLALRNRSDVLFEQLASDDQLFPYYRATFTG